MKKYRTNIQIRFQTTAIFLQILKMYEHFWEPLYTRKHLRYFPICGKQN